MYKFLFSIPAERHRDRCQIGPGRVPLITKVEGPLCNQGGEHSGESASLPGVAVVASMERVHKQVGAYCVPHKRHDSLEQVQHLVLVVLCSTIRPLTHSIYLRIFICLRTFLYLFSVHERGLPMESEASTLQ